ncbi:hypothetical protein ABFS82_12G069600 [Erythranthe guttata]|nr:PREDICTED: pre-mRNA-splicing factor SLU7-like [Erythranthe guttata]|eukprot:XP_012845728.1 PREDICTED: pre-mRNA-splicing factor SLU7-like [Erythranthe guttata]
MSSTASFRSRRQKQELEEARKAGIEPAELDEDGKEINPHIPLYVSTVPWYLNANKPTLKHQKNWKNNNSDRSTNNSDSYAAKRDPWKNFDPAADYKQVVRMHEARGEARSKYLHNQRLQKLDHEKGGGEEEEDSLKVGDSKQVDFGKVEKRVRTTGGGSTGTVRNLRIREDTAKYLLNLDLNSAHYDPKTRSMREDPLPDMDPNEKFYAGDNGNRATGQALEFKQLNFHAREVFDKMGLDHVVDVQGAPSQAELLYRNFKINKEKLKSQNATKAAILKKYGNAAANTDDREVVLPRELLLGQTEVELEYDRAGRVVKQGAIIRIAKSKYEEDVCVNNHSSIWGSWWKDGRWGYNCCHQTLRNTYCTGDAGIEAAASDVTKANVHRKIESNQAATTASDNDEIIRAATWGSQVPDDLVLNQKKLAEALEKEDRNKNQERDERKRKYNVKWKDEVTAEDMEAYRMKRVHHDDPIKDFLH